MHVGSQSANTVKIMKQPIRSLTLAVVPMLLLALSSCDGSTSVGSNTIGDDRPSLISTEYGRLVDVYAWGLRD